MNKFSKRFIFYTNKRPTPKYYSDNRDAYEYFKQFEAHEDCQNRIRFYVHYSKFRALWWVLCGYAVYELIGGFRRKRELFEINYLNQQPIKEYESEDYDYKFWELVRTKKTEKGEILINTDSACKENYVILYLAKIGDSGVKMQRFARLQQFILMRKPLPVNSVFVGMDEGVDPDVLDEYVEQYSKDIIASYPLDHKVREALYKTFINIGCIYLVERDSGNIICIADPNKLPLEAIGKKFIYIMSKNMDFRLSREVIKKEVNFKSGKEDELAGKLPLY